MLRKFAVVLTGLLVLGTLSRPRTPRTSEEESKGKGHGHDPKELRQGCEGRREGKDHPRHIRRWQEFHMTSRRSRNPRAAGRKSMGLRLPLGSRCHDSSREDGKDVKERLSAPTAWSRTRRTDEAADEDKRMRSQIQESKKRLLIPTVNGLPRLGHTTGRNVKDREGVQWRWASRSRIGSRQARKP